jgi:hypothetical protein
MQRWQHITSPARFSVHAHQRRQIGCANAFHGGEEKKRKEKKRREEK